MSLELGYWALKGLGEPVRLLLRYAEAEFKDATVPLNEEGMKLWFGEKKYSMGLDFPNLPYLIDGDVKVTQTLAIMRYLGRKFGLSPSDAQIVKADMLEQNMIDLRMGLGKIAYNPDFKNLKVEFLTKLVTRLEEIGKFIGDGPYALGDTITYVDFLTYEFLDHLRALSPDHFIKEGQVAAYMKRFEEIPQMKKWLTSEGCTNKTYTINAPMAAWPGKPVPNSVPLVYYE